jgi:hypothetical protein
MNPDPSLQPVSESSLGIYFRDRVTTCARSLCPQPQEETCWYVSCMLERFGRSEDCFMYDNGRLTLRPLALLYKDACESDSDVERCLILQQLGDLALFLGALFPEHFSRRGIHQDYLVGMGGGAYDYLSSNARNGRGVFAELANSFTVMIDLVASACSAEKRLDAEAVLTLYENWQSTRSPLLANQLRALGIDLPEDDLLH